MINEIYKEVEKIQQLSQELELKIKEIVKDKQYSLQERWKLFCDTDFGEEESCYIEFEKFDNDFWFEEMYKSKYEIINLKKELSKAIKKPKSYNSTKEEIKQFQEFCLENFIESFKLDW